MQVREHVARHRPWDVVRFLYHLPNFVRLFLGLFTDPRVSAFAKGLLVASAVYAFSPLDFLPDLMPMMGQVDDLAILVMGCRMFLQLAPKEVVSEHVTRIDDTGKFQV